MSFLNGLLGRATNTINNDVVKPIQRDVVRPVNKAYNSVATAINPQHGLPQYVNDAATQVPYDQRNQLLPPARVGEERTTDLRPQAPILSRLASAANRDLVQPVVRGIERKPAPLSPQDYTQHILDVANKQYHLTPQFQQDIKAQDPRFIDPSDAKQRTLPQDADWSKQYAGYFRQGQNHFKNEPHIFINKNVGDDSTKATELVHEGLHAEWAKMQPQQKAQFADTLQISLPQHQPDYIPFGTPGAVGSGTAINPRKYLNSSISQGYEFAPGSLNLEDIPSLPEHAINEARSYLPEYYQQLGSNAPVPTAIKQQYAPYIYATPTNQANRQSILHKILGIF